jgi:hypothetical protein
VLIINKGPIAATVSVDLGAVRRAAALERLQARAINAVSGVSLAGQTIGADGRWHGRRHIDVVRPVGRAYAVQVAGYSAALLTVGLR